MKKIAPGTHAFIIFEKLRQELADYDDEISPARAKKIIIKAISLLPGFNVEDSKKPDSITVRSITSPGIGVEVPLQNAIDSVMILWNESIRFRDAS